jgi:N-acetylmuramoyl-L-alanine amidase-like protein
MGVRTAIAVAILFVAAPGAALAAGPSIVAREVPLGGGRVPAAVHATKPFDLIGLHWRGSGTVEFRTRSLAGRWSSWHPAAPEAEDLPDAGTETRRSGWRLGNPWWSGRSNGYEVRTHGRVTRVRAWLVSSEAARVPLRRASVAGSPQIISRRGWAANEAIKRAAPRYAPVLQMAVVHHTAGSSGKGPEDSAAIVRGIELYHVKANGWNDIGYNFLVDRWGQVFEGRFGGMTKNVIGAHAQGFNTGSVGIALIGTYSSTRPTKQAESALASLISWRLDVGHVDPAASKMIDSGGNPRFRAGAPVYLRDVSGHRDTGFTSCPGNGLYARLPFLVETAATTGLPKLYDPVARGTIGKFVRFAARLSQPLAWSVTVVGPDGARVARKTGTGDRINWIWSSAGLPPGRYTWTMEATGARAARGVVGRQPVVSPPAPPPAPSPLLSALAVTPAVVSPDVDGYADTPTVTYRLGTQARVTVTLEDQYGLPAATLVLDQLQSAGKRSAVWPLDAVPDGRYRVTVSVRAEGGATAKQSVALAIMRAIGWVRADPPSFSPDGDGLGDTILFSFVSTKGVQAAVEVRRAGQPLALVYSGWVEAGPHSFTWDGRLPTGTAPQGMYELWVTASDEIGTVSEIVPFAVTQRSG